MKTLVDGVEKNAVVLWRLNAGALPFRLKDPNPELMEDTLNDDVGNLIGLIC
jgi:hypothetical protein